MGNHVESNCDRSRLSRLGRNWKAVSLFSSRRFGLKSSIGAKSNEGREKSSATSSISHTKRLCKTNDFKCADFDIQIVTIVSSRLAKHCHCDSVFSAHVKPGSEMSPPSHSCTSSKFGSKNFVTCRVRKFYLTSDSCDKTEILTRLKSYEAMKMWRKIRMFTGVYDLLCVCLLNCLHIFTASHCCVQSKGFEGLLLPLLQKTTGHHDQTPLGSALWASRREPRGTQIEDDWSELVSSSALCPLCPLCPVPDVLPFWPCSTLDMPICLCQKPPMPTSQLSFP